MTPEEYAKATAASAPQSAAPAPAGTSPEDEIIPPINEDEDIPTYLKRAVKTGIQRVVPQVLQGVKQQEGQKTQADRNFATQLANNLGEPGIAPILEGVFRGLGEQDIAKIYNTQPVFKDLVDGYARNAVTEVRTGKLKEASKPPPSYEGASTELPPADDSDYWEKNYGIKKEDLA